VAFIKKLETICLFSFLCVAVIDDDGELGFEFVFHREYCQFDVI